MSIEKLEEVTVESIDEKGDENQSSPVDELGELSAFVQDAGADSPAAGKGKSKRGRKKKETAEGPAQEKEELKEKLKEKSTRQSAPRRDNLAYIAGLRSLNATRRFIQTANAKKAKTPKDKTEVQARYDNEVLAGKEQLKLLLDEVAAAGDKIAKLIELDEEPNRIITNIVQDVELEFKGWFELLKASEPSKTFLRKVPDDLNDGFLNRFGSLRDDFEEAIRARYDSSDFRLRAACRLINYMNETAKGRFAVRDGKWVEIISTDVPSKPKAPVEPAALPN